MFKAIRHFKFLIAFLIIFLFIFFVLSRGYIYDKDELSYGITFSAKQAINLDLDWQELFILILDELDVKKIRIAAYWDEVEAGQGEFNWEDLDWQIEEASKREVELVLAVGGRLPRWPECHFPDWAHSLNNEEREERILNYIENTINRYKNEDNIIYWQVENEPFLPNFGECPVLNTSFLDREISLVKSLDTRPILLSDSGELSVWVPAAKRADIFGTTMYLDTYSDVLSSYIHYPIEPGFFRFKRNITRLFANPEKWIVVELQAEPWGPRPFQDLTAEERGRTMNLKKFREILEFSRQAGFREFYLWGVEWWYWEKVNNNNPGLWDEAKFLFP